MNCIILGYRSEIAKGLEARLERDGWQIWGWSRTTLDWSNVPQWDLVIVALGAVAPVGEWYKADSEEWLTNYYSNVVLPVKLLQKIWAKRNAGWQKPDCPSVCFLAGSNPQKPMFGYAAYNASKMALNKVCEQLFFETPTVRIFALGPGYVDTKIHKATQDAHWHNERIVRGNPTPIEKIYDCLKWCLSQPKEVVGGRNICVSDNYGPELAERLKASPNLFKLRRIE